MTPKEIEKAISARNEHLSQILRIDRKLADAGITVWKTKLGTRWYRVNQTSGLIQEDTDV